jgi:hypothetical protein
MKHPYPNNDKMSPEVSVLIRKNSHEVLVIRVISNYELLQEVFKVTPVIVNTIMKEPTK